MSMLKELKQLRETSPDTTFLSALSKFIRLKTLRFTEYPGARAIKAEVIKSGFESPKDLPRDIRLKLAQDLLQERKDNGQPLIIDPVSNMVAYADLIDNYGPDVFADLISSGYVTFTAHDQSEDALYNYVHKAIQEGWKQD